MPLPTDPLLNQQWHLINTVGGLYDLNVAGVWNSAEGASYTGAGIRVVVIDDGFDYNHTDLAPNYNQSLDYNFENNSFDPFGLSTDEHGTAVTGIIGADNNGTGAVGVAFDSELVGYRTEGSITDAYLATIAESINAAANLALGDVVNISQGIANDTDSVFGNGYFASRFDDIETSITAAVGNGRSGLGSIIVKSAGNARASGYDVNADDWTNDTRQVVVAAVNQDGLVSSYSSYGAALLVSAFGTPGQVVTTDRTGAAGYNATDFMTGFAGTSSAAPMVSGVVALMLEANGGLGWRDVQTILANSARHVGSAVGAAPAGSERFAWGWNAAATWNGGGMHFSNDYGYGLVDAFAAVRMAETWHLGSATAAASSNESLMALDMVDVATAIPPLNATGITFTGNAASADIVERVTLTITLSVLTIYDAKIYVTSPDGTTSILIQNQARGGAFNDRTWTFETQAFRGERADGTWSMRITNDNEEYALTVSDIVLQIHGAATTDDRYVYTNAYSDHAGTGAHVSNVVDTNGGIDTVNASALTTMSVIILEGPSGPASSIDGVLTTFSGIENAIGGDGGDLLAGGTGANQLFGMRGDDTIVGGAGNDKLDGGTGVDDMYGERDDDIYYVDNVGDTTIEKVNEGFDIVYSSVSYNLAGTFIERLELTGTNAISALGNSQVNTLIGNNGANTLNGLGGADTMTGGKGDDTYIVDSAADRTIELWDEGIDTVLSSANYSLSGTFVETLVLTGVSGLSATGNSQANTLTGNDGANTLNGLGGADRMTGAKGDDTYHVDNTGDRTVELVNEGIDTIFSSVSYNLAGTFIETLALTGVSALSATGNSLANTLRGNDGANILNGLGGVDTMTGGKGDDTYYVDNTGDRTTELLNEGIDTVFSSVSYNLAGTSVETLVLTGFGAVSATGNNEANTLTGNHAANTLNGLGGADTMTGGKGDDTYYVDNTGDRTTELLNEGIDTVFSLVSFNLSGTFVETLVLTGFGAISATGNSQANTLRGNDSANTLSGLGGADILDGGRGVDTLVGGTGADSFVFSTSLTLAGIDTIRDFSVADDTIRLANSVFTGLALNLLNADAFFIGANAGAVDDRIIYNSATGALLFDADGTGTAAAIQFANLATGLALTNADFIVV